MSISPILQPLSELNHKVGSVPNEQEKRERRAAQYRLKKATPVSIASYYRLGMMYHRGIERPVDYEKALWWYTRAAEQGEALAACDLGEMSVKGRGGPQDYLLAAMWFNIAHTFGLKCVQSDLDTISAHHLTALEFKEARKLAEEWIKKFKVES